jgi:2Fe-2S ferredoxin
MITVYFVRDGSKIAVDVPVGTSLMEAAKNYSKVSIPEIPADCCGSCACATCHVHVDERFMPVVGSIPTDTAEIELLEYEPEFKPKQSRLACQIFLTEKHNGLIVKLLKDL